MGKQRVEDIVEKICLPITEDLGLNLIDVEYKKEGSGYVLRVVIDKPEGIDIDDCESVSRALDEKLDELDPIEGSYNLEVQSPGERNLIKDREYEYFKGRDVEVKLYEAVDGRKVFDGRLLGLEDGVISIMQEDGEEKQFLKEKVANVKLNINF